MYCLYIFTYVQDKNQLNVVIYKYIPWVWPPRFQKKTQDYMFSSGDPHKKVSFPTGRGATPTYISHGPLILWEVVPKPGDLQANDLVT